jgi:hypothetical protein
MLSYNFLEGMTTLWSSCQRALDNLLFGQLFNSPLNDLQYEFKKNKKPLRVIYMSEVYLIMLYPFMSPIDHLDQSLADSLG